MDATMIEKIFADTAYIRTGGSEEELRAAEYIAGVCAEFGCEARLDPFVVDMATVEEATLTVTAGDGTVTEIPCKGYLCAGSSAVEAPFYYMTAGGDKMLLSEVRGKIVMIDGYLGYWMYNDLADNGALGIITYNGNVLFADRDIDQRELRSYVSKGRKLPCVNINAKDAVTLIENNVSTAKITLKQEEYKGKSQNVVLDVPGKTGRVIVLTAHYDSTSLSQGAYDNMSGAICLLSMAEYFARPENQPLCTLRFVWCGSEERGLLGSKAYCANHEDKLGAIELCINIDMIGCTMGRFIACCTSEQQLVHYIGYMGRELGFQVGPYQDVYSSDSTPFSDKGIPSVSFARSAPQETAMIHNSYDTVKSMKTEHMIADIGFITAFTARMANAKFCPVTREMPDNMKDKLDRYLCRKR
ncbi:MAG: M28 family peptidase [Clostridia bacterium]|nr:M28 family peptidase [Clostridia bacterium]